MVACIAFVIVLTTVIIPNSKYNSAMELYNAGQYEEALSAFEALNGYKDSAAMVVECKYIVAQMLYEGQKYDEAITAFETLNGYKDSAEQITKCQAAIIEIAKYDSAMKLYNVQKYEDAYKAFNSLSYKDSAEKAAEILFLKQKASLTNVSVGSTIKFGFYEQDNITSNGKEEIEWKVFLFVKTQNIFKKLLIRNQ